MVLGNAETLFHYVRSLATLGVARYDSFVFDGHSEYVGDDAHRVVSDAVHDELVVAERSDRDAFLEHMRCHEQGGTSYLEMSMGLADGGIEKWTVDIRTMTMTFYNRSGDVCLWTRSCGPPARVDAGVDRGGHDRDDAL